MILKLQGSDYHRLRKVKIMKLKKQNPHTESLDAYFEKRLGKEKYLESKKEAHRKADILLASHELKKEAQLEAKILKTMHQLVQSSVDAYIEEQKVGFNELVKILDLSPTYVSKMKKGQANLTFGTFAHVMAKLGKDPFEVLKIKK